MVRYLRINAYSYLWALYIACGMTYMLHTKLSSRCTVLTTPFTANTNANFSSIIQVVELASSESLRRAAALLGSGAPPPSALDPALLPVGAAWPLLPVVTPGGLVNHFMQPGAEERSDVHTRGEVLQCSLVRTHLARLSMCAKGCMCAVQIPTHSHTANALVVGRSEPGMFTDSMQ